MPASNAEEARRLAAQQRSDVLDPPEPPAGQPRPTNPRRYLLSSEMLHLPSEPPLFEVMIDSWGSMPGVSGPRFVKGDYVAPDDAPSYDFEWAVRQGVIRRLNMAEARTVAPSSTQSLTGDGSGIDPDLEEAGRFFAGFLDPDVTGIVSDPEGNAVTVTGPQGPREDPEYAKPTVDVPRGGQPAARPVIEAPEGADTGSHAQIVRDHFAKSMRDPTPAEERRRASAASRARQRRARERASAKKGETSPSVEPAPDAPSGEPGTPA